MRPLVTLSAISFALLGAVSASAQVASRPSPNYWEAAPRRTFVAGVVGGGASAYAELNVGYGRPFWSWFGFQGWLLATTQAVMGGPSLKLNLPLVNVTLGQRITRSYWRGTLPVAEHFTDRELDEHDAASAYGSWDAEVNAFLPLPHLLLSPSLVVHYLPGRAEPQRLYEELQRVIFAPPWLGAAKLLALFTWGSQRRYRVGALGELFVTGREQTTTRLGPAFSVMISPHLEVRGFLTLPISTPDSLNWFDASGASLTLRYRRASGD